MQFAIRTLPACLALVCCAPVLASGPAISHASACARLKAAVAQQQSPRHGASEYRCELAVGEGRGRYFVFALRAKHPSPPGAHPDWVGSSLVGWFAVSRSTGTVFEWDAAALAPGQRL